MNVLIDTDVLIDVALERAEFFEAAAALIDYLERHPGTGFVAWHSVSNFYDLVAPKTGKSNAKDFVSDLVSFVRISPTTTDHIRSAVQLAMPRFEDAMQAAAAIACGAEMVVTRNISDYARSPVPAVLPARALDLLR
ncbi:MAG: PIN domain-containing protein [Chromatiales bacterium]|nr:PIN domain-containing protein [Chromatiales bacterium]